MMQQVNLYLSEFRPNRELINALRVVQLAGFVVFVMAVVWANNALKTATLRSDIQATQSQLTAQTAITSQLQQSLARRASDPALVVELTEREQELAESREMLEFLRGSNLGNITGFSEYVKDISRAASDGLWLTQFNFMIGGQNVYLKGIAQQSAMVPEFINRLAAGKSRLGERDFSSFLGNIINTTPVEGLERTRLYQFELETRQ